MIVRVLVIRSRDIRGLDDCKGVSDKESRDIRGLDDCKGVSDKDKDVLEGVSNKEYSYRGVKGVSSKEYSYKGVSNNDDKEYSYRGVKGVSSKEYSYKGVSNNDDKEYSYRGVRCKVIRSRDIRGCKVYTKDVLEGVSNKEYSYRGVSNKGLRGCKVLIDDYKGVSVKDMKIKILKNTLNFLIFKYKEIEKNIFQSNFSVKRYKEVVNIYKGVSYKIESVNTSILNEIYKLFYRRIGRECNVYNGITIYECGNKDRNIGQVDINLDINLDTNLDTNNIERNIDRNIEGNIERSIERSIEGNKYITNEDYNIERSIEDITECNIDFNRFVEFDVNDEELKIGGDNKSRIEGVNNM
ncbi:hypothetical protein CWI38_1119p0020 [Hamiltosporidium tvaerminnensis]|uniref:Uncharacterized protein n=1 Tax=Hamiltosporidium tvaerminnensis TaxID=1176355 RepID=A0A4Q9LSP7_9MICR|nr:hypothetical protein CWI38_1119p0020 [Hamiltosporidium tvaerminnensis]